MGELTVAGSAPLVLAVVSVAPGGGRDRWAHGYACAGQNPGTLAGREARRQQPVVDLPRHGEAVERGRREEQMGVVLDAIRWRVDIAFDARDDAVAVLVHPGDLGRVCIEQPALQVYHARFKRSASLVDVQQHLVGEPARTPALPRFPLSIQVPIALTALTRQRRV